jgi:hypothetical protein
VVLALRRMRQEDGEFQTSMGYILRLSKHTHTHEKIETRIIFSLFFLPPSYFFQSLEHVRQVF